MKRLYSIFGAILALVLVTTPVAHASLWSYYSDQGQTLPSRSDRAMLAVDCGVVATPDQYDRSVEQNNALEDCLRARDISYWVERIKNNDTNPLSQTELDQVPEDAWKEVTPVLVNILKEAEPGLLGSAQPELVKQVVCRGSACDKYLKNSEQLLGYNVATGYKTTLSQSMTSAQATVPVASMAVRDGTVLTAASLGNKVFLTLEPGNVREEISKCTNSTAVLWSSCARGLAFSGNDETASTSLARAHNAGSIVVMSNVHYVYEQFVDTNNTVQTIQGDKTATGTWHFSGQVQFDTLPTSTTSTPTLPSQLITLGYLSTVTSTGCSNASTAVRGCVQEATNLDIGAGTATGTTGARLFVGVGETIGTSLGVATPYFVPHLTVSGTLDKSLGGGSNSLATLNTSTLVVQNPASATTTPSASAIPISTASGTISRNWLDFGFGGTGADGALTVSSNTTTLDAGGANVLVKNYTSINIALGATLTVTNTSASGTLLVLRSTGDVTITGSINLEGTGAQAGSNGAFVLDDSSHFGVAASTGGVIYSNKFLYSTPNAGRLSRFSYYVTPGSGGGNGGGGGAGLGGRGGGALILEARGSLNLTGTINVSGAAATNGANGIASPGAGGGGGGAAGQALVLYNALIANSGTFVAAGGRGGDSGGSNGAGASVSGGNGGGGAGNYSAAGANGAVGGSTSSNGNPGTTPGLGAGGSGAGGGGDGGGVTTGASGAVGGATDPALSLVTKNLYF